MDPHSSLHRLTRLRPRAQESYSSQDRTVLVTAPDGFITQKEDGLWVDQTRMLSRYRYTIEGQPPRSAGVSNIEQHTWMGYYIAPCPGQTASEATQKTVELRLSRTIGNGMHEDVDLTNYTQEPVGFTLEIELDADFLDQTEARKDQRKEHGEVTSAWRKRDGAWELVFDYRAAHAYEHQGERGVARVRRGLALRVERPQSEPSYAGGRISFPIKLEPFGVWHTCLDFVPRIEDQELPRIYACRASGAPARFDRLREEFCARSTSFETAESETLAPLVIGTVERAKKDLAALRLYHLDESEHAWTPAAGLPKYVGVYGRDMLTAAWQSSILTAEMMAGTLPLFARTQGRAESDWREEQPGRMLHQMERGPLAKLQFSPFERYYGSVTTSGFFPFVVSALWHWTGKRELVEPFLDPALAALRWRDRDSDFDGDGFSEYRQVSEGGLKNQGWKDSGKAIVYEDGSQVPDPIATCEEQAFLYVAKWRLAEVLWWFDRRDEARRLFHDARELKKRFNQAFWMEKEGFFALGLDPQKRQIRSIASNPGHCLAAAIVDESLVERTANRLMDPDLFSGWGVRTLSTRHPAYNPFSYQCGSVWPAETGAFALGFARWGFHRHLSDLCRAQFEAAALFEDYRLPEVFGGQPRDEEHPFPAMYPEACWPQAWSASSVFCCLEAMLALYPYAPLNVLLLDPHLPDWLPEITLRNLRVGDAVISLRFRRRAGGETEHHILELRGNLHVVKQPSPWSSTIGPGDRIKDALFSLLPGR